MTIRSRHKTPARRHSDRPRRGEPAREAPARWSTPAVRQSSARLLSDYRWYILGTVGAVAFVLGCWGYWIDLREHDKRNPTFIDVAYWSLKNFTVSAPYHGHLPWQLDIARFLAPVVAGWAGFSALGSLFRDRVQQMRIPLMRDHVVICGIGQVGTVFLRHLQEAGIRMVAIESNTANPEIQLSRTCGVPVVVGDAQLRRTLQAVGVDRAARLLAVTDDDGVNAQIVTAARGLPGRRPGLLSCMARITDPELCAMLRVQQIECGDSALSLDFFNIDEIAGRLLLEAFPFDEKRDRRHQSRFDPRHGQPHILVAHLDPMGAWLVYHAARDWRAKRDNNNAAPLVVTVLDDQVDERVDSVLSRYPALEELCKFIRLSATARHIDRLPAHHADAGAPPLTRAYVTAHRDEQGFETAVRLRHVLDADVPLVVCLTRTHGVAGLLGDIQRASGRLHIDVFSSLERTCTVELVRSGSFEPLARAIHERWRAEQPAEPEPPPTWGELNESLKESSRAQARDIPVKLSLVGCAIAPLQDWDAADFTFTDEEVERLAIAEHDRWMRERLATGWTYGEKDAKRKKSPYLVPWENLPPDIAEYDRIFVRAIPSLLASVGLQVIRTAKPESAQPLMST